MNYTQINDNNQVLNENNVNYLTIPSFLSGFENTNTIIEKDKSNDRYCFCGNVPLSKDDLICECCGEKMHIHGTLQVRLKHLPFGSIYTCICIDKKQLKCSNCNTTKTQNILFQAPNHLITNELELYIKGLLETNKFTNKEISYITGVNYYKRYR